MCANQKCLHNGAQEIAPTPDSIIQWAGFPLWQGILGNVTKASSVSLTSHKQNKMGVNSFHYTKFSFPRILKLVGNVTSLYSDTW